MKRSKSADSNVKIFKVNIIYNNTQPLCALMAVIKNVQKVMYALCVHRSPHFLTCATGNQDIS